MASETTPLRSPDARSSPARRHRLLLGVTAAAVVAGLGFASLFSLPGQYDEHTPEDLVAVGDGDGGAEWFCGEKDFETDYIQLMNKKDDHYFYWFVKSRSETASTDPLVIWLNGGPGASSLEGLLVENGPCLLDANAQGQHNPYAWNNNANVIWLEQPSGVGFSFFNDDADRDATGEDVGDNMYAFLDGFLDKHPEFVGRPFYLTGESYAGHYIPAAAYAIWKKSKAIEEREGGVKRINLQGVAIGNGNPNHALQYQYFADMAVDNAYNLTLLNETEIEQMREDSKECGRCLDACKPYTDGPEGCFDVAEWCSDHLLHKFLPAGRNFYDIRQPCVGEEECSDTDGGVVEKYLLSETVQQGLYPTVHGFERGSNSSYIYRAYVSSGDFARAMDPEMVELLNDGLRVLVFAGDTDLVCNWISNRAWSLSLDWKGKSGFNAANEVDFVVPKDPLGQTPSSEPIVAGTVRQFGNLAFLRVFEAGHLVPKNQPAVAWTMLDRFLKNEQL